MCLYKHKSITRSHSHELTKVLWAQPIVFGNKSYTVVAGKSWFQNCISGSRNEGRYVGSINVFCPVITSCCETSDSVKHRLHLMSFAYVCLHMCVDFLKIYSLQSAILLVIRLPEKQVCGGCI